MVRGKSLRSFLQYVVIIDAVSDISFALKGVEKCELGC